MSEKIAKRYHNSVCGAILDPHDHTVLDNIGIIISKDLIDLLLGLIIYVNVVANITNYNIILFSC